MQLQIVRRNMRVISIFIIALCSIAPFGSCKKDNTVNHEVQIRIFNSTSLVFYDCTVDPGGSAHNYGQVNSAANSDYHTFPMAYRYASIKLTMNNKIYNLQPYDYTGETALISGKYTYQIGYVTATDNLSLELKVD